MQESQLIEAISALAPMIEEHAAEATRLRQPVDAVMQAIEATGVYKYFVPKRYGGYEFSVEGFTEIGTILGAADVSTGWVVTFCIEHNWLLGLYNKDAQEEIFSHHPYVIAPGVLAPTGTARPVEGGYVLNGRWQWGTGVMHADHVLIGAITAYPDGEQHPPELCMYILPRDDVEVLDTWQMSGMVATGSNDIAVSDVFVPEHRRQNLGDLRAGDSPGARFHQSPTCRMPMLPFLGLTAACPLIGCANRTVERFRERMQARTIYGTADKQSERALGQSRLAHLTVRAKTNTKNLFDIARDVAWWGQRFDICPAEERAEFRVRLGHVVREARDIVRDVVEASGASAHHLDNPIQQAMRDLETASGHTVFDLDVATESYGRVLLGLPSNTPL